MKKRGAPALPDSTTFQQLWDTLGSKLIKSAQGNLLYTQGAIYRLTFSEETISIVYIDRIITEAQT